MAATYLHFRDTEKTAAQGQGRVGVLYCHSVDPLLTPFLTPHLWLLMLPMPCLCLLRSSHHLLPLSPVQHRTHTYNMLAARRRLLSSPLARARGISSSSAARKPVALEIDGKQVEVPAGSSLIQACEIAGATIPRVRPTLSLSRCCMLMLMLVPDAVLASRTPLAQRWRGRQD